MPADGWDIGGRLSGTERWLSRVFLDVSQPFLLSFGRISNDKRANNAGCCAGLLVPTAAGPDGTVGQQSGLGQVLIGVQHLVNHSAPASAPLPASRFYAPVSKPKVLLRRVNAGNGFG